MQFTDRTHAARLLVKQLKAYAQDPNGIVLAIPRGGVELGAVLADELKLPLDVVVSKKIGAPDNLEYAVGFVNMRGEVQVNPGVEIPDEYLNTEVTKLKQAIQQKLETLRARRPFPQLAGKNVIVVDDGIATGSTMRGALDFVRAEKPKKLILAVPVAPLGTAQDFANLCDEIIILSEEPSLGSVGAFYDNFPQVEDSTAKKLLATRFLAS